MVEQKLYNIPSFLCSRPGGRWIVSESQFFCIIITVTANHIQFVLLCFTHKKCTETTFYRPENRNIEMVKE